MNVGSDLAKSIRSCPEEYSNYLNKSVMKSFVMFPTDENEIRNNIREFPNKDSSGVDNIPLSLMKACAEDIVKPITCLVNFVNATRAFFLTSSKLLKSALCLKVEQKI